MTIVSEFANLNWSFVLSLNLTMSVLISNSLGSNNASLAKKYCVNVMIAGLIAFIIQALILILARDKIPLLFTQDEEV